MERLPLFFALQGRPVLLLGEGPTADAKARLIETAGAHIVRTVEPGVRLAFIALENAAEAEAAATALKRAGILVNVVDRPALCDFIVPAIVDRSPVIVAIGTGGASASLAKALRERLEALLPAGLGQVVRAIERQRTAIAATLTTTMARRLFWDKALAPGAPLDPLRDIADPEEAVRQLSITDIETPADMVALRLQSPDPDDLTLRQLRLLNHADTVFHRADVPPAVLDRARRDAVRVACDMPPATLPPGRSIFLQIGEG